VSFELLEHPADIGFRAEALTLTQLFNECARALQFIIFEPSDIEHNIQIKLDAEGADYESLLVNWLNELLYYLDSERLAFDFFEVEFLGETGIECTAYGGRRDPIKNPTKLLVKAVTYHQLRITHTAEKWSADVYVDV
jgi:SHS2 domain-containing protein